MNRLFDEFFGEAPLAERERGPNGPPPRSRRAWTSPKPTRRSRCRPSCRGWTKRTSPWSCRTTCWFSAARKKSEQEEKGKNWFRREQSYGSFHRTIELPAGVDAGKAKAQFKKGVLTFTAPKRPEEQARRKTVPIQAE
jgi:hypothetical protein